MEEVRKISLFDLDGTLADYHKKLKDDMKVLMSSEEKEINLNWNHDLPTYLDERKHLVTSQPDWWTKLPKLKWGWEILNMCEVIGFEKIILSKGPSRRDNAWTEKVKWCHINIPDTNIIITSAEKSLVYGRVLVDDYPDYVLPWLKWRKKGIAIMPESSLTEKVNHDRIFIYNETETSKNIIFKELKKAYDRE